jgi:hypothetical protein
MSTSPASASGWSWSQLLAAAAIVVVPVVAGGAIIWSHRTPSKIEITTPPDQPTRRPPRVLPLPDGADPAGANLHSVEYGVENGVPVIKIVVLPNGDELIVDAKTGRLLESRPAPPPSPSKAGSRSR